MISPAITNLAKGLRNLLGICSNNQSYTLFYALIYFLLVGYSDTFGAAFLCDDPVQIQKNLSINVGSLVTLLDSSSPDDRAIAESIILGGRDWTIVELERVVTDSISDDKRLKGAVTAIELMGELRAESAIPFLIEFLTLKNSTVDRTSTNSVNHIIYYSDTYPCAYALSRIGLPALDPLMTRVETLKDDLSITLASIVIQQILPKKLADDYLNNRIEHQEEPTRRNRLIKIFNKYHALN